MAEQRDRWRARMDELGPCRSRGGSSGMTGSRSPTRRKCGTATAGVRGAVFFIQKAPKPGLPPDPIAYDVPRTEGVVDLYLMPTYDDMASLYFQGGWENRLHLPPTAGMGSNGPKPWTSRRNDQRGPRFDARHAEPSV